MMSVLVERLGLVANGERSLDKPDHACHGEVQDRFIELAGGDGGTDLRRSGAV